MSRSKLISDTARDIVYYSTRHPYSHSPFSSPSRSLKLFRCEWTVIMPTRRRSVPSDDEENEIDEAFVEPPVLVPMMRASPTITSSRFAVPMHPLNEFESSTPSTRPATSPSVRRSSKRTVSVPHYRTLWKCVPSWSIENNLRCIARKDAVYRAETFDFKQGELVDSSK